MNKRIKNLIRAAGGISHDDDGGELPPMLVGSGLEKFVELLVKDVLKEVDERAYYCGDRAWSDETDRPWIEMEYGFGKLADAQRKAGIIK